MTAQIDMGALLPSERRDLLAAMTELRDARELWDSVEPIARVRAHCGADDVILVSWGDDDRMTARSVTRAAYQDQAGRDAPAREGDAGVPIVCLDGLRPSELGHAHHPPSALGRVVRATHAATAIVESIAAEQLAYRYDQTERRAVERASAPSAEPPVAPAPSGHRARWEDLSVSQMAELQRRSPAVFERLLADYRARRGGRR